MDTFGSLFARFQDLERKMDQLSRAHYKFLFKARNEKWTTRLPLEKELTGLRFRIVPPKGAWFETNKSNLWVDKVRRLYSEQTVAQLSAVASPKKIKYISDPELEKLDSNLVSDTRLGVEEIKKDFRVTKFSVVFQIPQERLDQQIASSVEYEQAVKSGERYGRYVFIALSKGSVAQRYNRIWYQDTEAASSKRLPYQYRPPIKWCLSSEWAQAIYEEALKNPAVMKKLIAYMGTGRRVKEKR